MDILLRQQGRNLYPGGCTEERCFQASGMERGERPASERPDCCFAKKVTAPSPFTAARERLTKPTDETDLARAVMVRWLNRLVPVHSPIMAMSSLDGR
eukprot:1414411-Pyramimonas_sp.AAC.1